VIPIIEPWCHLLQDAVGTSAAISVGERRFEELAGSARRGANRGLETVFGASCAFHLRNDLRPDEPIVQAFEKTERLRDSKTHRVPSLRRPPRLRRPAGDRALSP
jgi:hypothetical protein